MAISNSSKFYPIIKERWKNAVKIDDESKATSLAGFKVKFPSKLPKDYQLQLGIVETVDDLSQIFLYYSKNPITESMRWNEFFAQNGMTIHYTKEESDPEKARGFEFHIKDRLRDLQRNKVEAREITINGHKGIFTNQKDRLFRGYYDLHDPSGVAFVMDGTYVTINGYFAKEDLISVAESIK